MRSPIFSLLLTQYYLLNANELEITENPLDPVAKLHFKTLNIFVHFVFICCKVIVQLCTV